MCGCVCRQKTRLFAVLLLENRHEIALYRSASQFIFFERCLQSRTSLLSSAMAMVSNSCTARGGIEHYGNWVCRPTTSLRERCEHTTSTLFVSYCISDSAYSKSYKAKGSTCVSIFDQWLLWSGSRPAVQT